MRKWFERNAKDVIIISYLIPILVASVLSISHVVSWYDITNPISWAVYLSIGIEIAALSALAGIITKVNKYVYIPFILVTFIQFVGNVFYGYQYIEVQSELFQDWVELTAPLFDWMNLIEPGNMIAHKRLLAFIGGGLIPVISLSFLHLLVSSLSEYEEEEKGIKDGEDEGQKEDDTSSGTDETDDEKETFVSYDTIWEEDEGDIEDDQMEGSGITSTNEVSGDAETNTGSTHMENVVTGDTKVEESNEEPPEKEEKNEEKSKPTPKKEISKQDLPEWKKKNKNSGNNMIQRVDDYGKKRTK